jgi:F-type H+-transporting ATPase subunit b
MDIETQEHLSSSEFIDNAQNAVIEAVDNVSEMISETTTLSEFQDTHHSKIFYQSPEFWVGMAFVLVVVFLAKPISKIAKKFFSKRREDIIARINEAEKLRDEAQELLSQYERKFLHAKDEAKSILDKATAEIENITEYELNKIEKELILKQKETDKNIEASIENIKTELSTLAITKAIKIVNKYIHSNLDKKQHEKIIDNSIKNILNIIK